MKCWALGDLAILERTVHVFDSISRQFPRLFARSEYGASETRLISGHVSDYQARCDRRQ